MDNVFREIADTAAHGDSRYMEREFRGIDRLIRLNYDCPEAFQKFASRTGSRDIESIAAALRTVAESGGDLTELLKNGVNSLRMKQDKEREIRRSLSLPRMNHRILTFMPFGFILLFRSVSPAYITGLYEGAGLLVMGAVTILIGLAWLLGDRVGRLGFSL